MIIIMHVVYVIVLIIEVYMMLISVEVKSKISVSEVDLESHFTLGKVAPPEQRVNKTRSLRCLLVV